jgi:hypothetical protein
VKGFDPHGDDECSAALKLRRMPRKPGRVNGVPANRWENSSSVIVSNDCHTPPYRPSMPYSPNFKPGEF